ncbi:hypothetical protein [Curtobacterium sp. MCBA15_001]|uniref:hypothetical protein n=1 Tax=Curtobacterium sp. MCBA15_001 TaxID=1898731 RepID=UPI0011133917|nr:hypothetical protein [Curtobacterium sp. MCBA15_001]
MNKKRNFALAALGGLALLGSLVVAGPASAASGCSRVGWDSGTGVATATCQGIGQMRFVAHCNGYVGFPSWTKKSAWLAIGSGRSVTYTFSKCSSFSGSISYESL